MKKYGTLIFLIIVAACKPTAFKNEAVNLVSDCPGDGSCTMKIFPDKGIITKAGENNGNFHYEMVADAAKSTVVYEYSKNVPKNVMDAGLREEIVLEIDDTIKEGKFTDFPSAVFGRFCYCKGYTGYYKIKTGILTVSERDGQRYFNFQFKIDEVPQITQSIDFSIK